MVKINVTIIKIEPISTGQHTIQSQSGRLSCWLPDYIEVPAHLESDVWDTLGWCDLIIEDGKLTSITPTERPDPEPEPEPEPTQLDRVEAQATYTAMMTDTLLPEEV